MPAPKRRRLNPDAYPFKLLPLVSLQPDHEAMRAQAERDRRQRRRVGGRPYYAAQLGTLKVLRGEFDPSTLTDWHLRQMADYPGVPHLVFTNRIGQHHLKRVGDLVAIGLDLTKAADLINQPFDGPRRGETLTEYAARLRTHATQQLELADQYVAMAADGWALIDRLEDRPYGGDWVWDLRDFKPGPSYALLARKP